MILAGQVSYDGDGPRRRHRHGVVANRDPRCRPRIPRWSFAKPSSGPSDLLFPRASVFDQGGAVALGDRTVLRYGGEYVLVGLGGLRLFRSVRAQN